jgi:hypothetical protein
MFASSQVRPGADYKQYNRLDKFAGGNVLAYLASSSVMKEKV